jgi:tetratricopeptide (TPR) repeat protein
VIRQLRLAEPLGSGAHFVRACANAGITAGLMPVHRLAARYFARAVEALERRPEPRARGHLFLVRGMYEAGRGRWQAAVQDFGRVLQTSRPSGDVRLELDAISNLAYVAYFNGHYRIADELAERLLAVGRREPRYADEGQRLRMYSACQEERLATASEAAAVLTDMLKQHATSDAISTRTDLLAHVALIHAKQARTADALEAAASALELREKNASALGYYTDVIGVDALARALAALKDPTAEQAKRRLQLQIRVEKLLKKLSRTYEFSTFLADRASDDVARARGRQPRSGSKPRMLEPACSEAELRSAMGERETSQPIT